LKIVLFVEGQTEMVLGSFFALPGRSARPEEVNFDQPPSKLLARLYREKLSRSYKKVIDGASLFQALPPERAFEKCPYLKSMLNDMHQLAQGEA
jgi:hypothetical protein